LKNRREDSLAAAVNVGAARQIAAAKARAPKRKRAT
jgi:hypothetical protein